MNQNERNEKTYAKTCWSVEDITDNYDVTEEEAEAFLESVEDNLTECMILAGWNCIYFEAERQGLRNRADNDCEQPPNREPVDWIHEGM